MLGGSDSRAHHAHTRHHLTARGALPADICPPPDAFFISCVVDAAAACAITGNSPIYLPQFCTGIPEGAVITWYRGYAVDEFLPNLNEPIVPPVAPCPLPIGVTEYYFPFITSFRGRQDCQCVLVDNLFAPINCNFAKGVPVPPANGTSPTTVAFPIPIRVQITNV